MNYPLSITLFTAFLDDVWLSDDHVNMFVEDISQRLRDAKNSRVLVASVIFSIVLLSSAKTRKYTKAEGAGVLEKYEKLILKNGVERLYLPVNVAGLHWTAARIDFEKNTIAYGNLAFDCIDSI